MKVRVRASFLKVILFRKVYNFYLVMKIMGFFFKDEKKMIMFRKNKFEFHYVCFPYI